MSAYAVFNYSISDQDAYGPYLAGVPGTLEAAGAKIVVADFDSDVVEGAAGEVTVVLEFATREQLDAWYSSAEYEAIKPLRLENSDGMLVIAEAGGTEGG